MFIGKIEKKDKSLILRTIDGEEFVLAVNGVVLEEGQEDCYYEFFSALKSEQTFSGHRIANVLNVTKRHGPFVIVERIGPAVVSTRGVARGSKDTKVG